jgi:cation diffusion facilitator family transporter
MPAKNLRGPILLSLGASVLTLALKFTAYWLTGSIGLLSDAAETLVNVVASLVAYFSLMYSAQPVDREHTYGHEKIEFFSSGLEGVLILVASAAIAWHAVEHLLNPPVLESLGWGIAATALATVMNLVVALHLLRVGRAHQSIVLEADGHHLMTDVWLSVAVMAGISLVWATGIHIFDPICAVLVVGNISWTGWELVRRSFNGLMDRALPPEEQTRLRDVIQARLTSGMTYHAVRTRQAGARRFIDFHLLVPGAMSVKEAHDTVERIEEAVKELFPDIEVSIHIEPIEDRAAWEDSELVQLEQAARQAELEQQRPTSAPQ